MLSRPFVVAASNAVSLLIRLVIVVLVTNRLSSSHSDLFLYAYSVALAVGAFTDFGLRTSLFITSASANFLTQREHWGDILCYRAISGLVGAAIFLAMVLASGVYAPLVTIGMAVYAINTSNADPFVALMRGQRQNMRESLVRLAENLATLSIFGIILHLFDPAPSMLALTLMLTSIVRLLITKRMGDKYLKPIVRWHPRRIVAIFQTNLPNGISFGLTNLTQRFPVLLIPFIPGTQSISSITVSLMIVQSLQIVSTTTSQILMPRFVASGNSITILNVRVGFLSVSMIVATVGAIGGVLLFYLLPLVEPILNINLSAAERTWLAISVPAVLGLDFCRFVVVAIRQTARFAMIQFLALLLYASALLFIIEPVTEADMLELFAAALALVFISGLGLMYWADKHKRLQRRPDGL